MMRFMVLSAAWVIRKSSPVGWSISSIFLALSSQMRLWKYVARSSQHHLRQILLTSSNQISYSHSSGPNISGFSIKNRELWDIVVSNDKCFGFVKIPTKVWINSIFLDQARSLLYWYCDGRCSSFYDKTSSLNINSVYRIRLSREFDMTNTCSSYIYKSSIFTYDISALFYRISWIFDYFFILWSITNTYLFQSKPITLYFFSFQYLFTRIIYIGNRFDFYSTEYIF